MKQVSNLVLSGQVDPVGTGGPCRTGGPWDGVRSHLHVRVFHLYIRVYIDVYMLWVRIITA